MLIEVSHTGGAHIQIRDPVLQILMHVPNVKQVISLLDFNRSIHMFIKLSMCVIGGLEPRLWLG